MKQNEITTILWSNMHAHFRQLNDKDRMMPDILRYIYPYYAYTVGMPNTTPPIRTGWEKENYITDITSCTPKEYMNSFSPIIPLKILWGDIFKTTPNIISKANIKSDAICAKLYIRGTTTNSDDGVLIEDLEKLYPTFQMMEEREMLLLIHGEVPDEESKEHDMADREFLFHPYFEKIALKFPNLRMVFEHITDKRTVKFVESLPITVGATITTHHLYMSQNNVLEPGPRPRNACKPYAKFLEDREAIQQAALSGNPKFFFGDDTAWHKKWNKYKDCGHCGCAHTHSVEFVTQFFADHDSLHKLENFACVFGPQFYGLPLPEKKLTIQRLEEPYSIPREVAEVEAWGSEFNLFWKVKE